MKFKFSLESVFKVRKHQEKLQKQKLAKEVSKKQEINNMRKKVQHRLENYLVRENVEEVENVHQIKRRGKFMEEVHQVVNKLGNELEEVEISVEQERNKLAEAHKRRHIMEKMKEIERHLFAEKLFRQEQKSLDEIATQTFSYRRNG